LRDYEDGFVKEGVGAGALLLLAQLQGHHSEALVEGCERALDQLLASAVASEV
jgi:NaMN:DMB phosphoribosyltransferase